MKTSWLQSSVGVKIGCVPNWFDRRNRESATVTIPLQITVEAIYVVYFAPPTGANPTAEDLAKSIDDYVGAHLEAPIRDAAIALRGSELFSVRTIAVDQLPAPPLNLLRYGRMSELDERIIQSATHAVVLRGQDLNVAPCLGLWTTLGAALAVRQALDGVVFDPEALRIVKPDALEWFTRRGAIAVAHHIIVPSSIGDTGLGWVTTRGLGKFGLPDLEVRDVPPNLNAPLHLFMDTVAQLLVEAALETVREKRLAATEMVMPAETAVDGGTLARAHSETPSDPKGERVSVPIGLRFAPEDRAPEVAMIRLVPPRSYGNDTGVWLSNALDRLVGSEHEIRMARTRSEAMQRAHERAIAELPALKARFQAGLGLAQVLFVKHGFPTPSGSAEFMWLAINRWEGTRLVGQLSNEPREIPGLRIGQTVTLAETDVFDWMIQYPDGGREGGYTNEVALNEGRE